MHAARIQVIVPVLVIGTDRLSLGGRGSGVSARLNPVEAVYVRGDLFEHAEN